MLYTVKPLERIYASPSVFEVNKKTQESDSSFKNGGMGEPEYREVLLPNGRIVTRRVGENYVIERINSTDMHDYLNDEYAPGKSYKEKSR